MRLLLCREDEIFSQLFTPLQELVWPCLAFTLLVILLFQKKMEANNPGKKRENRTIVDIIISK